MLTNYSNLPIIDMGYNIADIASKLRANYKIKTADATIIATGVSMNVDYLITNDMGLRNICDGEGIEIIIIEDIEI